MKGKSGSSVSHLKVNGQEISDMKDITNTLAQNFAKNSSSNNCTEEFKKFKQHAEKSKLNFKSSNNESYNQPFSLSELEDSLNKSHDTASGPDDIPYQFLKHLSIESKSLLLKIYNDIFISGDVPESWKQAIIIPLPKPGRDSSVPSNYRPISLTSCVCKTFERMINDRLVWYLELNDIISPLQSGFRKKRSTTDHLVKLETFIREAFIKKEHVVAVFFDLEKAYDTTWTYGIMKDLHEAGLKGHLPKFISSFLDQREFQVRVGTTFSEVQKQDLGVPQGSVLSVTLFGLKINSIVKCLNTGTEGFLYVDDFCICFRSKNMNMIERQLQQCLNKIHDWSNKNGFRFSKTKTNCTHFCNLRNCHRDPDLYLDGTRIPVKDESKFLGLIFDKKLSFIPHIKYLKAKCIKALNILKVVSSHEWGADKTVLLRLYRSLIRSKLDYGSIVYGSARKSYLNALNTIHHHGIRIALGAFRTSPVESLYVEANEPSLELRRQKLSMQYAIQLKSNTSNPTHNAVFEPNFKTLFERKPTAIPTFGIRVLPLLREANIDTELIFTSSVGEIPPWTLSSPFIDFSFSKEKKGDIDPVDLQRRFNIHRTNHADYMQFFTDGSKADERAAAAMVTSSETGGCRLPDHSSIFTAEVTAIAMALCFIKEKGVLKSIIYTDSLSVLKSLKHRNFENPFIHKLFLTFNDLFKSNRVVFCWIPSHLGIPGNDKADRAAKDCLDEADETDIQIPFTDLRRLISSNVQQKWQNLWNLQVDNKLFQIQPQVGPGRVLSSVRKEEVVLTRIRIGHTRLT